MPLTSLPAPWISPLRESCSPVSESSPSFSTRSPKPLSIPPSPRSKRPSPFFSSFFLIRSEEHTSEPQPLRHLECRFLLEKKNITKKEVQCFVLLVKFAWKERAASWL